MALELARIDERLIHGQVLVGWGARLGLEFYVVVDDDLAASEWEQEIWASALGEEATALFLSVADAIARFAELDGRADRGAILTRGTAQMRALAESGCLEGRRVNLGGLHDREGRRKVLDYVYLAPSEEDDLKAIDACVGSVSARALPTSEEVALSALVTP